MDSAKKELVAETRRIFGGENPELLDRLQPLLDRFGLNLETQVRTGTNELLEKAAKQFDPADPTSPMAKHTAALAQQQEKVSEQIEKNHVALAAKVDELTTALKVQEAKTSLAKVTPIKGSSFEGQIHDLMRGIAAGLGDEYDDTTTKTGLLPRICWRFDTRRSARAGLAQRLPLWTATSLGGSHHCRPRRTKTIASPTAS